jgi:hypothetical protein
MVKLAVNDPKLNPARASVPSCNPTVDAVIGNNRNTAHCVKTAGAAICANNPASVQTSNLSVDDGDAAAEVELWSVPEYGWPFLVQLLLLLLLLLSSALLSSFMVHIARFC